MEYLTERMRSRCHHRSHAIPPCASERPRHRRRHRPSRNPDGSTDRSEESRTSRPRLTNRSPPISTVRSEGSRDADLRAVRDCRGPKRATRTRPLLAPTPSGPKPFERWSSRRARSSRLPRMARDGHTVHAGHRHEGFPSHDGWFGAEAPRQPPRSGSGPCALSAPARHVDTSPATAEPPAPLATTAQTRCCHRIHPTAVRRTSGCPLCCHRRRRQLRSAAPASLPPQYAAFDPRPKPRTARVAPRLHARARPDTQAGAPQQTIASAHSARCPEPTVPTSPPTRSAPRVRASSPVPNRIAKRSGLHQVGANPNPAVARREPKPAPPIGNEAAKKLGRPSDIPVRCHHRSTASFPWELHSSGTCRPGEPFRRAPEPHTSRSWKQCHVKTASVLPPSQPPRGTCGAEDPQIQRHFA